jgi:two-component system, NarL family, sensor histidine kinase DesK
MPRRQGRPSRPRTTPGQRSIETPGGGNPPSSLLVLCGLFAVQLTAIFAATPMPRQRWATGLTLVCAGSVFALQLFHVVPGALRWPTWRRLGMLLAQGVLTYLPLTAAGVEWAGMAGFLAGSTLVLMPPRISWVSFMAVIASVPLASLVHDTAPRGAVWLTMTSLSNGLTVFGISRLCLATKRAHGVGIQLAQLTSLRERERFSRDLHDLLGYGLSAIALKAELTRRLVGSDPALARVELAEVTDLARQAASDVRLVANGYRNLSLASEAASAASLLSTAGITVQVEIGCGSLDDKVDTVLATVLREGVTNVLRHSAARHCAISANQEGQVVMLAVTNDGVQRAESFGAGCGLDNLAWRLEAIGGELHTVSRPDGHFSLQATVPAPER